MDKRSILFAVILCTSFYGVQAWFDYQNKKEKEVAIIMAQKEAANKQKEIEYQLSSRLANISNLPITSLFLDNQGLEKIATVAKFGDNFLTLSWADQLPAKAFVQNGSHFQEIELSTKNAQKNEPVIFKKSHAKEITLPAIPSDCPVDLQLVTTGNNVRNVLAEQKGYSLTLPYQYLEERAIAFMQNGSEFLPVGIYDPEEKKVKSLNQFQNLHHVVQQQAPEKVTVSSTGEQFYVLENKYQMLVFSTKGGAISEINLPLYSKENDTSYVKEIDFDREIQKHSPQNASFPLYPYFLATNNGKEFSEQTNVGGYYPLLRRPIINANRDVQTNFPSQYYALSVVGDDPSIANIYYQVTRFEPNLIQFVGKSQNRKITKTFRIPTEKNGPYCFELDIQVEGDTSNLWISSGVPDVEIVGGSYSPLLRYQHTSGKVSDVETIDLPSKDTVESTNIAPNWVSNCNGFFGIITDPLNGMASGYKVASVDGNILPTRLTLIDPGYNLYPANNYPGYQTFLPIKSGEVNTFRIYAGPYDRSLLKTLDELYDEPLKNYNPDYSAAQKMQGWFSFISEPFAKFLELLMQLFYAITHSWAFSIVLLTIALRVMMQPFNAWSLKSNAKMQQYGPQIQAIREKHKKDPSKGEMEVMQFYKQNGINPFAGCIPSLLTLPFMFGMFYALKTYFPLRGAPFIPGWIDDLAAPDILFYWNQPIWFIGNEFHLLPILAGVTMYYQMAMMSPSPKGTNLSESQQQQKVMGMIMPVMLTFFFYNFPSGLSIYFTFSNILALLQQKWTLSKLQRDKKS